MDKNRSIVDFTTFKFLYKKYKEFTVPLIVFVVCTILLFTVIAPQFKGIIDLSKGAKESERNLAVLKNNFDLLSSLNEETLDSWLRTVNVALPSSKDFFSIINAISYTSLATGIKVGDFQVSIGELSDEESGESGGKLSSISMNLSVAGDAQDANRFIEALYTTLPLSEVTGVNTGNTSSEILLNFYYKSLPPTKVSGVSRIDPILSDDLALINNLAQFNFVGDFDQLQSLFEAETSSNELSSETVEEF